MSVEILLDTNVLVYAYDRADPVKQQRAFEVIDQLTVLQAGAISTQVLSEFFVAVTRKIPLPLAPGDAYDRIQNYLQVWPVFEVTGLIVLEAARGVRDHQFSFWDALIWATARFHQVPVVFSEDFRQGATVEGVRFVNPFAADFRAAEWIPLTP